MTKKSEARQARDEKERRILFPFRDIVLMDGTKLTIWQWPAKKGARLSVKVLAVQQKLAKDHGKETTLETIAEHAFDEISEILQESVEWSDDEWAFHVNGIEDFLRIFEAVWYTSILRPGGGTLPLILKIAGVSAAKSGLDTQVAAEEEAAAESPSPSQKPSTDLSEPATP